MLRDPGVILASTRDLSLLDFTERMGSFKKMMKYTKPVVMTGR